MNLQKTRTLNVSSHANPAELHDAMTAKLQAAVAEADEQPQVIEAAEVHQKAESQLARLRQAHRTLNDSACRLSATLKKSLDEQVSRAIELAGDGRELEAECLADCARLDIQHGYELAAMHCRRSPKFARSSSSQTLALRSRDKAW